jgi:hypothetical protein
MREFWGESIQLRYGRGVFFHAHAEPSSYAIPPCALKNGGEHCGLFSLSTTGTSPPDGGWAALPEPAGTQRSAFLPSADRWTSFSPGRDGVYAFAMQSRKIHRIDDRGRVSVFLEDAILEEASIVHVFEVGGGVRVLFSADLETFLAEVIPGDEKKPGHLGARIPSPMAFLPQWRQSAQGIRQIAEGKKMPLIGTPTAVSLPGDKDGWALLWAEGLAPPYDWPKDKPFKSKSKSKRGAKNECGGPSSRPLSDRSIEKRLHITRFRGITQVSDVVVKSTNDFEEARSIVAVATDRGIELNGVTYDLKGKEVARRTVPRPAAPVSLELAVDEGPISLAYDPGSQQGLVMLRRGRELWSRRFDAEGKFLGEAIPFKEQEEDPREPVRIDGRWYAVEGFKNQVLSLEEGRAFPVEGKETPSALVAQGPGKALVLTRTNTVLRGNSLDLRGGSVGPAITLMPWDHAEFNLDQALLLPAAPPTPARIVAVRYDRNSRKAISVEQAPLVEGAAWAKLWEIEPDVPDFLGLYEVPGDIVAVLSSREKTTLRWLRAGKSVSREGPELAPLPASGGVHARQLSAILAAGAEEKKHRWALLPGAPVAPFLGDSSPEVLGECAHGVRTGPGRVVLLCGEGGPVERPSRRIGLRALTLPAGIP